MAHFNIFTRGKSTNTTPIKRNTEISNNVKKNNITKTLNQNYIEMLENCEHYIIDGTELSCMSYSDMEKASICIIDKEDRINNVGTVNDNRLGIFFKSDNVDTKKKICNTCGQNNTCPGHNGLLKLNHHFICPLYIKYVIWILTSICNECSELLIDKERLKDSGILQHSGLSRLQKIYNESKGMNVICRNPKCNNMYKCVYYTSNTLDINEEYKIKYKIDKIDNERSIDEIEHIFKNITKENLEILGFSGNNVPENLIIKGLLVIPKCVRQPSFFKGRETADDITQLYCKIIKDNNKYLTNLTQVDRESTVRNINRLIHSLINNKKIKSVGSLGVALKSITEKISNKDGYIRGQAMGKRVNFCLRSVAGPGYDCDFGEARIPQITTSVLTSKIPVIKHNLQHIMDFYYTNKLIKSIKKNGSYFQLNYSDPSHIPEIGNTIEVYCTDGSYYLINRQPSLHKYSIMGVKAKHWDFLNIGLHSSLTTPLNADFDGDELNCHRLQTIGAQIEAKYLVDVGSCIMNSQTNSPTMGLVFNCPNASFIMTDPDLMIEPEMWDLAIKKLKNDDYLKTLETRLKNYNIKLYSGKALFSVLLPPDFFYKNDDVKIENGILISGRIGKKHIGPSSGSIIQILWKHYNKKITSRFFTEGQYILDWFIEYHGFSIGYSSCVGSVDQEKINNYIDIEIYKTKCAINSLPYIDENSSDFQKEYNEQKTLEYLNNLENIGKKIGKDALPINNDFKIMLDSGAKGNLQNVTKILGTLGQTFIYGKRPPLSLNNNTRCNVYCVKGSKDLKYRGYCKSSFMTGLDPLELFFHLMASRTGLIDTAIKTSDTGFLHHKINKNFEDIIISYDGSVRNVGGKIYSFSYSDGFDAANLLIENSKKNGKLFTFVDIDNLVDKINYKYSSQ